MIAGRSLLTCVVLFAGQAAVVAAELTELSDALLSHFVDRCRVSGRSWAQIGTRLGVTRQAIYLRVARWRKAVTTV